MNTEETGGGQIAAEGAPQEEVLGDVPTPYPLECSSAGSCHPDADGHFSGGAVLLCSLRLSKWSKQWSRTALGGKFSPKFLGNCVTLSVARLAFWTGLTVVLGCQPDILIWMGLV